jgi:hypothetical protein
MRPVGSSSLASMRPKPDVVQLRLHAVLHASELRLQAVLHTSQVRFDAAQTVFDGGLVTMA